jgi:hypothetical protein
MPRLAAGKQRSRPGPLPARKRRPRLSPIGYLANPASLTGIPKLDSHHSGTRLTFGDAKLTALAQTLVEIDLVNESDWIAAGENPSALVDRVFRRLLREHGQEIIAEHFELCLSLAESIFDTTYTESEPPPNGQLLLVLNTQSSFPLRVGNVIEELERHQPGLGAPFYNCLRQALYRWVRVYDDWDARNRIEQMTEWAEGEDDPDSYEIPKLEQDLPECLKARTATESLPSLTSFAMPEEPWLRELVQTATELERVSQSIERPKFDEEWLEQERSNHALDSPLPAILVYFRPGDAVMACFDDECEYWGQETPEPNLIIPLQPEEPESVRLAFAVLRTLLRVLVLTVRIKTIIDEREKQICDSASMSEAS